MGRAPPGREPGRLHRRVAVEAEAGFAQRRDPAHPAELLRAGASVVECAEVAGVVADGALGGGFDVERVPVADGGELEDGGVEPVLGVAVDAAGFGEGDGEVSDVGVGEKLTAWMGILLILRRLLIYEWVDLGRTDLLRSTLARANLYLAHRSHHIECWFGNSLPK